MSNDKTIFEAYVSVLGKQMKLDVDPCENFFEYATGNYCEEMKCLPPQNFSSIISIILKNEKINLPSFVKARDFYESFKNETNFKELLKKSGLFETFGGWPAYESEWNSEKFDWISVAAQLAALGMQTIISHETQYDNIIKNIKAAPQKPTDKDKAGKVLKLLGVTDNLMPDVLSDIQSIIDQVKALPPMKFANINTYCQETIIPYKELHEEEFDYNKYFEVYFGKPLNNSDEIWLENKEYFDKFLKIFKNCDRKQIANYIFWMAGKTFLEGDIPLKLTIEFFSPSLIATLFTVYYNDDYKKSMYALNTFVKKFKQIKHKYNGCDAEHCYFEKINEALEIKDLYFQQESIEEDYASLEINPENFLQNIKNLQEHYPTKAQSFCSSSDEIHQMINYPRFMDFLPTIVFNYNKPMVHHFIGNGLRIWINTNGGWLKDIVDKNSRKYPSGVLEQQLKEKNIKDDEGALRIKAFAVSLKQIFADYKEWLGENPEASLYQEETLRPLGLNNEKAFFVAYAQRFSHQPLKLRWAAELSLRNMKLFSDIFKCKIGSRMNKTGKFMF